MGWTEYEATNFKNGRVDRKAECDNIFTSHNWCEVVKSSMVGNVYYGAIKYLKRFKRDENNHFIKDENGRDIIEDIPKEEQKIIGYVVLTSVRNNRWFAYKDMSESSVPCYYDCPKSILKLLSDTDDEWALEWRKVCYENIEEKKNTISIGKLPIGTKIEITKHNGEKVILKKYPPSYQFKTPFWVDESSFTYMQKKHIPKDFKIISQGI